MANSVDDLWGSTIFPTAGEGSPLGLLLQQAGYLAEKTQGVVAADVVTSGLPDGAFLHSFDLVVPALDGVVYTLFRVRASLDGYPARVSWQDRWHEAKDLNELTGLVKTILRDDGTRRKVSQLMAMVSRA